MPTWISDEKGILHPAKESVALRNISDKPIKVTQTDDEGKKFTKTVKVGGEYIYEGPDRAALFQWWEENGKPDASRMKEMQGKVTFGEDFKTNTEFREQYAKARNMFGFNSVEEYLKYLGYENFDKVKEEFNKKASVVNVHEMPTRMNEIKKLGGGSNTARGSKDPDRYGGFGDLPNT